MQGNEDIWLLDGARVTRFTNDAALDNSPVWSPDGTRLVFRSSRTGVGDLYQRLASGAGGEEQILASDLLKIPTNWSADGAFLLFYGTDPEASADLWSMPIAVKGEPSPLLQSPFRETWPAFSPDSRWVAYESNESGQNEIYVRRFMPPTNHGPAQEAATARWQVSTAGGIHPLWRPDGKEIFYINPAGEMVGVPIAVSGPSIELGAASVLFPTHIWGGGQDNAQRRQYDIARDGRFLINAEVDDGAAPITLIQNWQPEGTR